MQLTGSIKSYSVILISDCLAGLVTPAPFSGASQGSSSFPSLSPCWPLKLRPYKCETHETHAAPLSCTSAPTLSPFLAICSESKEKLEKRCGGSEGLLLLQRTRVRFPAGHLTVSCDLCRYHIHRHTPETHIQKTGCTAH